MAETKPQSYANHAKYVPLYHFVLSAIVLIYLVGSIWQLVRAPGLPSVLGLLVGVALVLLFYYSRIFALKAQDRLIELEERLRLERLLPADLRGRMDEISRGDYIGLRFASDGEVAELVQAILAGEVKGRKAVKQRIRVWRADHRRL